MISIISQILLKSFYNIYIISSRLSRYYIHILNVDSYYNRDKLCYLYTKTFLYIEVNSNYNRDYFKIKKL